MGGGGGLEKVWQFLTRGSLSLRLIDVNSVIFYDKNLNFNRWIYNITVSPSVQSSLLERICKICNFYVASQAGGVRGQVPKDPVIFRGVPVF